MQNRWQLQFAVADPSLSRDASVRILFLTMPGQENNHLGVRHKKWSDIESTASAPKNDE